MVFGLLESLLSSKLINRGERERNQRITGQMTQVLYDVCFLCVRYEVQISSPSNLPHDAHDLPLLQL